MKSFFVNSIVKIVNQSKSYSISSKTKQQLNSLTIIFIKRLKNVILKLEIKKITLDVIIDIFFIFLTGDLLKNSIKEGNQSIEYFENSKGITIKQKSRLLISPSSVKKIMELKMSSEILIFIASIIEYVIVEIINATTVLMKNKKRIKDSDIINGIKNDTELSNFVCMYVYMCVAVCICM